MAGSVRHHPRPAPQQVARPAPQQDNGFFSNWNWSNIAQVLGGIGVFLGGLAMYNRSNRTEVNNYYGNSRGNYWWGGHHHHHRHHDRF